MKFIVEINTGDMYWDNTPIEEELKNWSIDDLKSYLPITDKEVQELLIEGYTQDEDNEFYHIWLVREE